MVRARTLVATVVNLLLLLLIAPAAQAQEENHFVDMTVSQTDAPDPVLENNFVIYSVVVTNKGPDPANGISVSSTLSTGRFVSGSGHRWSCQATSETSALCMPHFGALPKDTSSSVLQIVAQAPAATTANKIVHTAVVSSSYADVNPVNNTSSETTNITPGSDLTVDQADEPDPVDPGDIVRYLVTVNNNANSITATGVKLTNEVDIGQITKASGSGWTCTPVSSTKSSCDFSGSIAPDSSAPQVEILVRTVFSSTAYTLSETARVTSATADSNTNNNMDTETTLVKPGSGSGYIPPQGGQISTCAPNFTTPDDTTCATGIFPPGPGGIAQIIELGRQLDVCQAPPGCSGEAVDFIPPPGYVQETTAAIVFVLRVDFSVSQNRNDMTRKVWVQKKVEQGEQEQDLQTVAIPSCDARIPGLPCLRRLERESGTLTPDLSAFIELFSGDPIFEIGDGTLA